MQTLRLLRQWFIAIREIDTTHTLKFLGPFFVKLYKNTKLYLTKLQKHTLTLLGALLHTVSILNYT